MEVILGGISSLLYGVADFLGGEGAKRAPAAAIVLWAGVISFPMILVVALVVGGDAGPADLLLGAAAGIAGAVGLVSLFAGLSRSNAAAVAPTAAAVAAVLPVIVAVIGGERPSTLAWVGVAVAVPAIVLSSWVADPGDTPRGRFGYGLAAGLGFGGFTSIIGFTAPGVESAPAHHVAGSDHAGGSGADRPRRLEARRIWLGPPARGLGNAVLDVSGNVALLLAVRAGSLALAAVAASFYPAVTVLLARLVNAEHLRSRQIVGLVLTILAMAAIALG